VAIQNNDLLSSSETGVDVGIKSQKSLLFTSLMSESQLVESI
jgi:hypothetical protein